MRDRSTRQSTSHTNYSDSRVSTPDIGANIEAHNDIPPLKEQTTPSIRVDISKHSNIKGDTVRLANALLQQGKLMCNRVHPLDAVFQRLDIVDSNCFSR